MLNFKILITVLVSLKIAAQTFTGFTSLDKVKKRRKHATLLFRVYQGKDIKSEGTAFFVSKDGYILTAYHNIQDHIKDIGKRGWRIEITSPKKKDLGKVKVVHCSEERTRIDVCLLKLETKNKIRDYFPVQFHRDIKRGTKYHPDVEDHYDFFSFGHPLEGYYIEVKSRLVEHYKEPDSKLECNLFSSPYGLDKHISQIRVKELSKNKYSKGHSGAPVFDRYGKLVGLVTGFKYEHDSNCRKTGKLAKMILPAKYLYEFYVKHRN